MDPSGGIFPIENSRALGVGYAPQDK